MLSKSLMILGISLISSLAYSQVQYLGHQSSGKGCPNGTASVTLAPDNSSFTILYSEMQTQADGPRKEARKVCDVVLNFEIPKGLQLEFTAVEYRGFMGLDGAGAWGYVNSRAYFVNGYKVIPGGRPQLTTDLTAPILRFFQQGPLFEEFTWRADYNGRLQRVISACQGSAQAKIKTEIISSNGPEGGSSSVNLDSVDGSFSQEYKIALKPCETKQRR